MPPVNSSASPTDVDNEATAELPVLDVAAYEETLSDPIAHTDTWVLPTNVASKTEEIPTLRAPDLESTCDISIADYSGTHEMPAMPQLKKLAKHTPPPRAAASPASAFISSPAPIVVPPSPPLIEELRNALASAARRIEELDERARIAEVERGAAIARANAEAAQLRQRLEGQNEALSTSRGRLGAQRVDESALEDELFARADRIAALEKELAAQGALLSRRIGELEAARSRGETLDTDGKNLRATLAHRNAQIAMLEADLAARQQKETSLQARLTEALASIDPNVPALREEIRVRDERLRVQDLALKAAQMLAEDKNQDLQVAEESIRNLEIEVRDKTGKLEEASVTVEEWRAVIAESQRSILERDSRIRDLQSDLEKRAAAVDSAAQTSEEVALEGPARVLIRTDGNTDFVHVLGRRTRIGRGNDNEMVLDTKHISRYHAVLLAGPVHTSIEDLNSTNGVFVNGKRVSRQALKDGDKVTIGRTQFRYTVRT